MHKLLELNQKELLAAFSSMAAIKTVMEPVTLSEVDLNFETSRSALETIDGNLLIMAENPEELRPTIIGVVMYEIDPAMIPSTVNPEILEQIPGFLLPG